MAGGRRQRQRRRGDRGGRAERGTEGTLAHAKAHHHGALMQARRQTTCTRAPGSRTATAARP
eukprot:4369035-Pleurochrysis_carterae.AAC.1